MAQPVGLTPPPLEALRDVHAVKKAISTEGCEILVALDYIELHVGTLNLAVKGQRHLNDLTRRKRRKT